MQKVYSVIYVIFFIVTSTIYFIIALLVWLFTVLFDKRLVALNRITQIWGLTYIKAVPSWSIKFINRDKADKKKTYVIVSNHQSNIDIMAGSGLFFHFKWISKAEVLKIPFIGWTMRLNRYITFKRGDTKSIKKMMEKCEKAISENNSILMFPEGTRSKTGTLRDFKTGAFILAKKMKVPILPVVINGTRKALPKDSIEFGTRCKISVEVLDEIPYKNFADKDLDTIAKEVRAIIQKKIIQEVSSV